MAEETTEAVDVEATEVQETEETPAVERVEDLPEWAQKAIEKANKEAAKYRVRAKEAADETAKTLEDKHREELTALQEKYEGTLYKAQEMELRVMRQSIALELGVPVDKVGEFADRLRGEDEEALRKDAASLYKVFGLDEQDKPRSRLTDPSQSSTALPLNGDPLLNSVRRKLGL